jgi:protein SCO1/2
VPGAGSASEPAGTEAADYVLRGVVRSVKQDSGKVVIRHEAIPGFMSAMTMPFPLADRALLDTLREGDEVEGTLRVERRDGAVTDYQLVGLKVTKAREPAPAARVIDLSRGTLVVREQPKRLQIGDAVPDFTMTAEDGSRRSLAELRGNVIVLTFIYTRCPMPDFCPLMDRKFRELAQHLSAFPGRAKEIRLISLSFDPEHDTPEILRKHARIRGAVAPLWTYAVASHEELAKIAAPLGLMFGADGTEIAHNLSTAIIDREGKLARLEVGTQANRWQTADFLKTIYSLLASTRK